MISDYFPFILIFPFVLAIIILFIKSKIEEIKKIEPKIEPIAPPEQNYMENNYKISFRGDSITFFKIWITNLFLTICTLGIYYPWGRAKAKKYLYSSTYFEEYNFEFHGTGKHKFKELLKLLIIILPLLFAELMAIDYFFPNFQEEELLRPFAFVFVAIILIFIGLSICIIYAPVMALFIHGARSYGMAKTSYKGISFGYIGDKKSLVLLILRDAIFTFLTFGIYYPWFINNVRKYIYCNTIFGNVKINFQGINNNYFADAVIGFILFIITIVLILFIIAVWAIIGWVLSIITFGVLYFWFEKVLFNFFYENISFSKDGQLLKIKSNATALKYFKLISLNCLIILFTIGLGYPFAKVRSIRFIADNLEFKGNLDLNNVIYPIL